MNQFYFKKINMKTCKKKRTIFFKVTKLKSQPIKCRKKNVKKKSTWANLTKHDKYAS